MHTLPRSINRILCIRIDRLGDMLVSTPFFRALRQHMPNGTIDVLASKMNAPMLANNPHISRIHIFDKSRPFSWPKLICTLRKEKYQAIIVLTGNSTTCGWIAKLVHAPQICAIGNQENPFYYSSVFTPPSGVHQIHKLHAFLEVLGILPCGDAMELVVSSTAKELALQHYPRKPEMPRIGIFIGNQKKIQSRWPEQKFAGLVEQLLAENKEVLLFAGPYDTELLNAFAHLAHKNLHTVTLHGTPEDSAALFLSCDLFVSSSTGPLHMAVAAGVPSIVIQRTDANDWSPLGAQHTVLNGEHPNDVRDICVTAVSQAVTRALQNIQPMAAPYCQPTNPVL